MVVVIRLEDGMGWSIKKRKEYSISGGSNFYDNGGKGTIVGSHKKNFFWKKGKSI